MNAGGTGPGGLVPQGDRVILSIRPDAAYVVLAPMWSLAGVAVTAVALAWSAGRWPETVGAWVTPARAWTWSAVVIVALIAWRAVDLATRRYILTDRRIVSARGVFRRVVVEAPLENIQHVTVTRLVRERLTGLGTLGFATSGTAWVEMHWVMIARPAERLEKVRREMEASKERGVSV